MNKLSSRKFAPQFLHTKTGVPRWARGLWGGGVCCVLAFAGCGSQEVRLPVHKVSGSVVQNGVGVANATVVFHSDANQALAGFIRPRAITDAQGAFQLTTYESGDGAPVGDYVVTVEQWINDNPEVGATNRLPKHLGSPTTSELKATVAASENNQLQPFELPQ